MLEIAGIALSVLFFLIGYRQTIGAKKERLAAANREIEALLLRRLFVEALVPSVEDIRRILDGKSRDHRVPATSLYSEEQIVNSLFTRVMETDLLTAERRNALLGALIPRATEAAVAIAEEATEGSVQKRKRSRQSVALTLVGVSTALATTLLSLLTEINPSLETPTLKSLLITIAGSVLALLTVYYLLRARTVNSEADKESVLERLRGFEQQVARLLNTMGIAYRMSDVSGADFEIPTPKGLILVEAKVLTKLTDGAILGDLLRNLEQARTTAGAVEAVLVTPGPVYGTSPGVSPSGVRQMTLRQLQAFLKQRLAQ